MWDPLGSSGKPCWVPHLPFPGWGPENLVVISSLFLLRALALAGGTLGQDPRWRKLAPRTAHRYPQRSTPAASPSPSLSSPLPLHQSNEEPVSGLLQFLGRNQAPVSTGYYHVLTCDSNPRQISPNYVGLFQRGFLKLSWQVKCLN